MMAWLEANPFWAAIIRVCLWVFPVLLMVPFIIWYERRLLSWMQDRIGPNRTGNITFSKTSRMVPFFLKGKKFTLQGIVQPLADGLKLVIKEDITPGSVDRLIYLAAPALALFPSFALGATIPWGPFKGLTPVADVNIGVLWILAISSLGVYGVVLSGYASNNKYSLLGGLRSSAQLISYELGMSMSLAAVCLATGSLKPTDIVESQTGPLWGVVPGLANWNLFTPYGFVAGIIFFICMVAETNRAPFDLPEAENELVAGYHTEYSSFRFAVFFMGEYAAMFVYSLIFSTVFLGGYHALPINWVSAGELVPGLSWVTNAMNNVDYWFSPVWLVGKAFFMVTIYVWLRATLPRLRYDQLMSLGWKSLLPLATINTIVVALWLVVSRVYGSIAGVVAGLLGFGILYLLYRALNGVGIDKTKFLTSREIDMVDVTRSEATGGAL